MEKITTSYELKMAIQRLEAEQTAHLDDLKGQLHSTYERLKPANLLKSALNKITSTTYLNENVLSPIVALASGYIAKKITVGSSNNLFRKILGSFAQFEVTNVVSKHAKEIISFVQSVAQQLMSKKEEDPSEEDEQ
jgi:triphosphoribosyl-dephospho-CoA synthetase